MTNPTTIHCTGQKGNCHTPYLRQEVIDTHIGEILKNIVVSGDNKEIIFKGLKTALKDKIDFHNNSVKALEENIAVIQKRLDSAYMDKLDGNITDDFWRYNNDKWLDEKEKLTIKLLAHQRTDSDYLLKAEMVMELAGKAYDLFLRYDDSRDRRKLVNLLFSNSSFDGKTLHFTLRKPFDTILECAKDGKWGGWLKQVRNHLIA